MDLAGSELGVAPDLPTTCADVDEVTLHQSHFRLSEGKIVVSTAPGGSGGAPEGAPTYGARLARVVSGSWTVHGVCLGKDLARGGVDALARNAMRSSTISCPKVKAPNDSPSGLICALDVSTGQCGESLVWQATKRLVV